MKKMEENTGENNKSNLLINRKQHFQRSVVRNFIP